MLSTDENYLLRDPRIFWKGKDIRHSKEKRNPSSKPSTRGSRNGLEEIFGHQSSHCCFLDFIDGCVAAFRSEGLQQGQKCLRKVEKAKDHSELSGVPTDSISKAE